jgi:N-terminal acetyltransferase 2
MRAFRPILKAVSPRIHPLLPTYAFRLKPTQQLRSFTSSPSRLTPISPLPSPSSLVPPTYPTLTQRLKQLIKSYGWYALGVYLLLSALDFGVAFVGVNLLGAEYVSRVTASAKSMVTNLISKPAEPGLDEIESTNNPQSTTGGNEGLYAMLLLAYTIHKTLFVPVRIGLTAAFTPRLVAWLTRKGWAGGAGTKRAAQEMREKFRQRQQ